VQNVSASSRAGSSTRASQPARQLLKLLHTNVMGPLSESLEGSRYIVTVLDDWLAACVARPVKKRRSQQGSAGGGTALEKQHRVQGEDDSQRQRG